MTYVYSLSTLTFQVYALFEESIDFLLKFFEILFRIVAVFSCQGISVLGAFKFIGLILKIVAESSSLVGLGPS